MQFLLIIIVLAFLEVPYCQWSIYTSLLNSNSLFTQKTGQYASQQSGSFLQLNTQTTAHFITCTTQQTSYITLNNNYPSVQTDQTYFIKNGFFVAFDLYFQGTWENQVVKFQFGSFEYQYQYESPSVYPINYAFCDNKEAGVKTVNFTISTSYYEQIQFTSLNTGTGQVSIRNLHVSYFKCFPSCSYCNGPGFQYCTSCYFQTPTNGICPTCPTNQYYMKYTGCKLICDISSSFFQGGFCQNYPIQTFVSTQFTSIKTPENLKWSLILDSQHIDNTLLPNIYFQYQYIYGIFKYNSGVYRFINELSTNYATYSIGLKITLFTFNEIPLDCGIHIKIIDQLNLQ
ncbi:unnamed protein product [Paramecium pentaurelia]|uniref:Transmembrane protein n=1 Tax=Paramecium pentaurelia TaxID=43138 RepID=A0A8S1W3E4_9CILI|nr:unnamed protein product [Paramecium pentaurelia]